MTDLKKINEIISIVLIMSLLVCMMGAFSVNSSAVSDVQFIMQSGTVTSDGTFTLTLTTPTDARLTGAQMKINYDKSMVEYVSCSTDLSGMFEPYVDNGVFTAAWADTNTVASQTVAAAVTFKPISNVCGEAVFTYYGDDILDENDIQLQSHALPVYMAFGVRSLAISPYAFSGSYPAVVATFNDGTTAKIRDLTFTGYNATELGVQSSFTVACASASTQSTSTVYLRGDTNNDGDVGIEDYAAVMSSARLDVVTSDPLDFFLRDINEDNVIDVVDVFFSDRIMNNHSYK